MAWFDPKRNRGHKNYDIIESGSGGLKHGFIGYSSSTTSERYESTQRVFQHGGFSGWPGPVLDNPLIGAGGPIHHARPKDHEFYRTNGPPWNTVHKDRSPPTSDHLYGTHTNFSRDESDDDERDFVSKNRFNGPKPKNKESDYEREKPRDDQYHEKPKSDGYRPPSYTVRVSTPPQKDPYHESSYNEKPIDNTYNNSPPSYTVNGSAHPKKDPYRETSDNEKPKGNTHSNSPPFNGSIQSKKDPYHETSNNGKPKGTHTYSNSPPSHIVNGSTHPKKDPYHEKSTYGKPKGNESANPKEDPYYEPSHNPHDAHNEKPKSNINSPFSHIVNGSTHPKKDPNHETSYNPHDTYNEKPRRNSYGPPSYIVPHTTQPRKDADHETSTDRPMMYPLPPIKTSTNKGSGYLGESPRDSPVAAGTQRSPLLPRKAPPAGQYNGTIDSQEAARRYGGVFVDLPMK